MASYQRGQRKIPSGDERVACVACGRLIRPSKNGHPRKHAPTVGLRGHFNPNPGEVCAGTFEPGEAP